eukprot:TRINITY_DN35_c1_g1_i2.p1 TRINITY_DN35_c1_g1~~TRINITY_DN35_c1_g1_i2.p1  ORF type:complete len:249 (+),score=87.71 TRINITY_DN35_c1_g1_i2:331-1077(+)
MERVFESYSELLEGDVKTKEEIRAIVRELNLQLRLLTSILQQIHSPGAKVEEIVGKANEQIEGTKHFFQKLTAAFPPQLYHKFCDNWRPTVHQFVFLTCLSYWLETSKLLSFEQIQNQFIINSNQVFRIELEDYLIGLCNLPNELARLCLNAVTAGNFEQPIRISAFVKDLFNGFRLLNLKNDLLRRKFDTIKYDIKKCEEVVYDISIRKLAPINSTNQSQIQVQTQVQDDSNKSIEPSDLKTNIVQN